MKDKIVKITVESDSFDELEAALEHRFGLKEACVVPKSYDMQVIKQNMARAGLGLLRRIIDDGKVVGLAWGTTISELAKLAEQEKKSPAGRPPDYVGAETSFSVEDIPDDDQLTFADYHEEYVGCDEI